MEFLIVCPLVFLAGFVDAIAGGGGLISLPAYLIAGLPVHHAIGTNKLSSCMGTTLATYRYWKRGYIPWKEALICVACALVASNIGARLGLLLDDRVFRIVLLFVLPLTALYLMTHKSLESNKTPFSFPKTILISMLIASVIGCYDGFYGPGTGTFLIILLTGAAHMSLGTANGISKSINLATNVSSLVVFLMHDTVVIQLGLIAGCCSILGNYIGTRFFDKGGAKIVKPMIFIVIGIFFVKTIVEFIN